VCLCRCLCRRLHGVKTELGAAGQGCGQSGNTAVATWGGQLTQLARNKCKAGEGGAS
jgi:hypothetical protein